MRLKLSRGKKPKKTRLLKKDEKKALLDMLSDLASNSSDVVSAVINIVAEEVHIHVYKEQEKFTAKCSALDVNFGEGTD